MARTRATLATALCHDDAYCALSAPEQHLHEMLLRQPDLSHCGVLTFTPVRLARQARDLTAAHVTVLLAALVERDFVVFDGDTSELALRSFFASDGVLKNPGVVKAAANAWRTIHSAVVQAAVLDQLPGGLRDAWPEEVMRLDAAAIKALCRSPRLPFPAPARSPQDDDCPVPRTSHPPRPVDESTDQHQRDSIHSALSTQHTPNSVERETIDVVVERRMARRVAAGTVFDHEPAYRARVRRQVIEQLGDAIARAAADNADVTADQLAALLDSDSAHTRLGPHVARDDIPAALGCDGCDRGFIEATDGLRFCPNCHPAATR